MELKEGVDNIPEHIDYLKAGYSSEEASRMGLLVRIESAKYYLEIEKQSGFVSEEDIEEAEKYICEMIDEYNKTH